MAGDGFNNAATGESSRLNVVVLNQASGEYVVEQIAMAPEMRAGLLEEQERLGTLLDPAKLQEAGIEGINPQGAYISFDTAADVLIGGYNDSLRAVVNRAELIRMEIEDADAQKLFHEAVDVGEEGLLFGADMAVELIEGRASDIMNENVKTASELDQMHVEVEGLVAQLRDSQALAGQIQEVWFGNDRLTGMDRMEPNYDQFKQDIIDISPTAEFEAPPPQK